MANKKIRLSRKEEEIQKALGTAEVSEYKIQVYIPITGIMLHTTSVRGVSARDAALKLKRQIENMPDDEICKLYMESFYTQDPYYGRKLSRDRPIKFRGDAFASSDWWHSDMSDEEYEKDTQRKRSETSGPKDDLPF